MGRFIDSLSRSGTTFDTLVFDLNNSNDEVTGLIADRSDVMLVLFSAEDGTEMAGRWSATYSGAMLRRSRAKCGR